MQWHSSRPSPALVLGCLVRLCAMPCPGSAPYSIALTRTVRERPRKIQQRCEQRYEATVAVLHSTVGYSGSLILGGPVHGRSVIESNVTAVGSNETSDFAILLRMPAFLDRHGSAYLSATRQSPPRRRRQQQKQPASHTMEHWSIPNVP